MTTLPRFSLYDITIKIKVVHSKIAGSAYLFTHFFTRFNA